MSFRSPFNADFWIEPEPPSNMLYLNTPFAREHALANARQAAMTLEEDRTATRKEEIEEELRELYAERERVNVRIFDLEGELVTLKGGRCG